MKNVEFGFFFTAFVAIIGALILTAVNEASSNISQVLLTLALVLITCIYVMRTSDIAKATRAQAIASVKMAEEMREQRIITSRPLLIIKSVHEKDIWEGSNKDYFSHFEICNVGNSPAIEVESSLMDNEDNNPSGIRQTYLRNDDSPIKFHPYGIENLDENKTYYLVCEYQNIFSYGLQKQLYQTSLPFKISKSGEEGKIYMIAGELELKEVAESERIDAFSSRSKPK